MPFILIITCICPKKIRHNLIQRFHASITCLNAKNHVNKNLREAWYEDGRDKFEFIVLECGQDFSKKATRLYYEKAYVDYYKPNVYNFSFSEGRLGRSAWNKISVYKKDGNQYRRYENISATIQKGLTEIRIFVTIWMIQKTLNDTMVAHLPAILILEE